MSCLNCGKEISVKQCHLKKSKRHFCSKECFYKHQVEHPEMYLETREKSSKAHLGKYNGFGFKKGQVAHNKQERVLKHCANCKKELHLLKRQTMNVVNNFCSNKCIGEYFKKMPPEYAEMRTKIGEHGIGKHYGLKKVGTCCSKKFWDKKKCNICGIEFLAKQTGHGPQKYCSVECRGIAQRKEGIKRTRSGFNGRKDKEWRIKVFKRDDYTCRLCFEKGGKLNAHHKIPYRFEETRYDLDNGLTLCVPCHRFVHSGNEISDWPINYRKKAA